MANMLTAFRKERQEFEDRVLQEVSSQAQSVDTLKGQLNGIQLNQQQTATKLAEMEAQAMANQVSTNELRAMFAQFLQRSNAIVDVFQREGRTTDLSGAVPASAGAALTPASTLTHPAADATTPH